MQRTSNDMHTFAHSSHKNAIYPFNDLIYEHLVDVDALSKLKNLRTNEHHKSTLTLT